MLEAAIGSAAVALVAVVGKEFIGAAGKALFSWSSAFLLMPQSVKSISSRVDDIDRRLGRNGDESVFEMLHALENKSQAALAKERLRANRDGAMIWHSNSDGTCAWASKPLQDLVGSTFEERFQGMNWLSLFFEADRANIAEAWGRAVSKGAPFIARTRYKHADGHEISVRLEAFPLPDGAVLGMVTVLGTRETGS